MANEQDRPDVLTRRQAWFHNQIDLDPDRPVFIDETWANTNMGRTHGRCRHGERLAHGLARDVAPVELRRLGEGQDRRGGELGAVASGARTDGALRWRPLTIAPGLPRRAISALISRTSRFPHKDVSGTAARHSLVTACPGLDPGSSMIVSTRNRHPSASWSCTKSVDQRLSGSSGLGIGLRATAIRQRDLRRRTARSSSR